MIDQAQEKQPAAPEVGADKEPKAAAKAKAKVDNSHLIAMTKGDETLDVHPTCVNAHKAAGWQVK